jgi:hypothetical protein
MSTPQCRERSERPRLRRFSPQERERLARLRRAVERGERSDFYPVDRRQEFVRWLIAEGRLSDGEPREAGPRETDGTEI